MPHGTHRLGFAVAGVLLAACTGTGAAASVQGTSRPAAPGTATPVVTAAPIDASGPAVAQAPPVVDPGTPAADPSTPRPDRAAAALALGAARYVPMAPERLVDTRLAIPGPAGIVGAGQRITVDIGRAPGRPAGTITAAAITLTAVDAAGPGFVTAWPTGAALPEVSTVNLGAPRATVPNFAIVPVAADGTITVEPSVATHLIVDLAGIFVTAGTPVGAGRLLAVTPTRVLDTRSGAAVAPDGTVDVHLAGLGGVPPGAAAVAVTVTAVDAAGAGFVTVWPGGTARPEVSSLNVPGPGATVADVALVPLGPDGNVRLYTQGGAHLLVDLVGYVTGASDAASTAGLFVATGPDRRLDTRQPSGPGVLPAGTRADLALPLPAGLTPESVGMVAANLTLTGTTAPLFLTAWPARTSRPDTSNVNADAADESVASFALVPLGAGATISLDPSARTHALVDVAGFFLGAPAAPSAAVAPTAPTAQGSPSITAFDQVVQDFMTANGVPGASVAVAKDGRLVYARAYGMADPWAGEAMRVEHHFRIASLSKTLTGITVERLAAAGTLSLDQPAWTFLARRVPLPAGADPRIRTITIRQLMGHVSGIPASPDPFFDDDPAVLASFGPAGPTTCDAAARWTVARPLTWDPGTHYSYANVNFCLLGLVIEQATGRPWQDVVREQAELPRGVTDMYLGKSYERQPLDVVSPTPALLDKDGGWFMESIGAGGAWMGTPVDLVRIIDGMDPAKPGAHLLDASQLAEMRAKPSTARDPLEYYGLALINYRSGDAFGHTGALDGSRTLVVHEADGITWSVMMNLGFPKAEQLMLAMMDAALATVPLASWPAYDLSPDLP